MITINETLYKKMPDDIKACFNQLPNPSSEEVRECFPESNGSGKARRLSRSAKPEQVGWGMNKNSPDDVELNDAGSGNASRFFKSIIYQAKASKSERQKGCEELYILKDNTPKEDIDEIKHLLSI